VLEYVLVVLQMTPVEYVVVIPLPAVIMRVSTHFQIVMVLELVSVMLDKIVLELVVDY